MHDTTRTAPKRTQALPASPGRTDEALELGNETGTPAGDRA